MCVRCFHEVLFKNEGCVYCSVNDLNIPDQCLTCQNNLKLTPGGDCVWDGCDDFSSSKEGCYFESAVCDRCSSGFGKDGTGCSLCEASGGNWLSCSDCDYQIGQLMDCTDCNHSKDLMADGVNPVHQCRFPLIANCQTANLWDPICDLCDATYYWDGTNCASCGIDKCDTCRTVNLPHPDGAVDTTNCDICQTNFEISLENVTYNSNGPLEREMCDWVNRIPYCQTSDLDDDTKCLQCYPEHYFNTELRICEPCTTAMNDCLTCTHGGQQCLSCYSGFDLLVSESRCYESHCTSLKGDGTCDVCDTANLWYLDWESKICIQTCEADSITAPNLGKCWKDCGANGYNIDFETCSTCDIGPRTREGCTECSASYDQTVSCDTCTTYWELTGNNPNTCIHTCDSYNGADCSTCITGYLLTYDTKLCVTDAWCVITDGYSVDQVNNICAPACASNEFYDYFITETCVQCDTAVKECDRCYLEDSDGHVVCERCLNELDPTYSGTQCTFCAIDEYDHPEDSCSKCDTVIPNAGRCEWMGDYLFMECYGNLQPFYDQFDGTKIIQCGCDYVNYLSQSDLLDKETLTCARCSDGISNCAACNVDGTECEECLQPYFLSATGTCTDISCRNWDENGDCIECNKRGDVTWMFQASTCVTACELPYEQVNATHCEANCPSGTFEDPVSGTCPSCGVTNCNRCFEVGKCNECTNGLNCVLTCDTPPHNVHDYVTGSCHLDCDHSAGSYSLAATIGNQLSPFCNYCGDQTCLSCRDDPDAANSAKCFSCPANPNNGNAQFGTGGACTEACTTGEFQVTDTISGGIYCDDCSADCAVCSDETTCTQCNTNFILFNNECQGSCPSGTPEQTVNGVQICGPCNANCNTCTTSAEADACVDCVTTAPLFLLSTANDPLGSCNAVCPLPTWDQNTGNNVCVSACNTGMGPETSNRVCQTCSNNIANCDDCENPTGDWTCTTCNSAFPLTNDAGTLCFDTCPTGSVFDTLTNVDCASCPSNCASGCYFNTTLGVAKCNACDANYYLTPDEKCVGDCSTVLLFRVGTDCVDTCPTGTGVDYFQGNLCGTCTIANCAYCHFDDVDGHEMCDGCDANYFWYQSATEVDPICKTENDCDIVADFSPQKYDITMTDLSATVFNSGNCTACAGYWDQIVTPPVCTSCTTFCKDCSWHFTDNIAECFDCQPGSLYHTNSRDCVDTCIIPFLYEYVATLNGPNKITETACWEACPTGTSPDIQNVCLACAITDCMSTSCEIQSSQAYCTACNSNFAYNGACIATCPNGYGQNAATGVCDACTSSQITDQTTNQCKDCTAIHNECNSCYVESAIEKCFACNTGYSASTDGLTCDLSLCQDAALPYRDIANTTCVAECGTGEGVDNIFCTTCQQSNCDSCTFNGQSMSTCNECATSFNLETDGTCVGTCHVANAVINNVCQDCPSDCATDSCEYNSVRDAIECTSCLNTAYVIIDGYCLSGCESRKYYSVIGKTCNDCMADCATCTSGTQCSLCDTPNYLYHNLTSTFDQCETVCPSSTYQGTAANGILTCFVCDTSCSTCNGGSTSDCLTCSDAAHVLDSTGAKDRYPDEDYVDIIAAASNIGTCQTACLSNDGPISGVCFDCQSNCAVCSQGSCSTCSTNYILSGQTCVINCALMYGCSNCDAVDKCTGCDAPFFAVSATSGTGNVTCALQCLDEITYVAASTDTSCTTCGTQCATCNSADGFCLTCAADANHADGIGKSPSTTNALTCNNQNCPTNCKSCTWNTGTLAMDCDECMPTYSFEGDNCILTECLTTEFWTSASGCQACSSQCATCSSATGCLTCPATGTPIKHDGDCIASCALPLVSDFINNVCVSCTGSCDACEFDENDALICLECAGTDVAKDGFCVTSCPDGWFMDQTFGWCVQCDCSCSTCDNRDTCTACKGSATVDEGVCSLKIASISPVLSLNDDYITAKLTYDGQGRYIGFASDFSVDTTPQIHTCNDEMVLDNWEGAEFSASLTNIKSKIDSMFSATELAIVQAIQSSLGESDGVYYKRLYKRANSFFGRDLSSDSNVNALMSTEAVVTTLLDGINAQTFCDDIFEERLDSNGDVIEPSITTIFGFSRICDINVAESTATKIVIDITSMADGAYAAGQLIRLTDIFWAADPSATSFTSSKNRAITISLSAPTTAFPLEFNSLVIQQDPLYGKYYINCHHVIMYTWTAVNMCGYNTLGTQIVSAPSEVSQNKINTFNTAITELYSQNYAGTQTFFNADMNTTFTLNGVSGRHVFDAIEAIALVNKNGDQSTTVTMEISLKNCAGS